MKKELLIFITGLVCIVLLFLVVTSILPAWILTLGGLFFLVSILIPSKKPKLAPDFNELERFFLLEGTGAVIEDTGTTLWGTMNRLAEYPSLQERYLPSLLRLQEILKDNPGYYIRTDASIGQLMKSIEDDVASASAARQEETKERLKGILPIQPSKLEKEAVRLNYNWVARALADSREGVASDPERNRKEEEILRLMKSGRKVAKPVKDFTLDVLIEQLKVHG